MRTKKQPLKLPRVDPVFTASEWIAVQPPGTGSSTAYDRLLRARQRGLVTSIGERTGVYAVLPPGADPSTHVPDRLVAAGKMMAGCPLAYHSALEALGRAHSVGFGEVLMLCPTASRRRPLGQWTVRPVRPPRPLQLKSAAGFGLTTVQRQAGEVLVTNSSRTLVDCLDRVELGGGFEEVVRSLENFPSVDFDEVLAYLDLLASPTTAAKVGYALDLHAKRLYFTPEIQKRFERRLPRSPVYLRRETPTRLVAKWRLLVPERLVPEAWEE